jgi:hypothetical protein
MAVQAKGLSIPAAVRIPGIYRAALINLAIGLAVALVTALAFDGFSAGFLAGYMLGFVNLLWLFRIIRKGLAMAPEKAMGFVSRRYFARFVITAGLISVLIARGVLSTPWPPLTGIALSVFTSVGALIFIAKEEFK